MSFQHFRLQGIPIGEPSTLMHHDQMPLQAPMSDVPLQHTDADAQVRANSYLQGPAFQVHIEQSPLVPVKPPYGSGDSDDGYTLVFETMDEFQTWRAQEEEEKMVEFVKGDTHGSKAVPPRFKDHTKLVCARHSRSGRKKYVKKHPERQRKVPSRKIEGEGCPASISYKTYYGTDMVRAMYISSHSHEIGLANLPFTRRGRKAAADVERIRTRANGAYRANPVLNGSCDVTSMSPQSNSSISGDSLTTSPHMQSLSGQSPQAVSSPLHHAHHAHQPVDGPSPTLTHHSPMMHAHSPSQHHHQHQHQVVSGPSPPLVHHSPMMHTPSPSMHHPVPPARPSHAPDSPYMTPLLQQSFSPSHAVNVDQERWDRMSILFQSIRDHARSFEYPGPSVAALESVLIRLYLESPLSTTPGAEPTLENGMSVMNGMDINHIAHMNGMNVIHGMSSLNAIDHDTDGCR